MQLHEGNLSKVLTAKFFGTFGSEMLSFAISLYILKRTGSALSMGISLITGPVISVALTPFIGYVVDNFSHKKIMVASQLGTILSLICFAVAFTGYPQAYFTELVALIALLAVTDDFLSTALQASLTLLFKKDELQKANSLNQSISSMAEFLAPVLGAVIYTLIALDIFAYIEAGFETIALVAIYFMAFRDHVEISKSAPAEDEEVGGSVLQNFLDGIKFLWWNKLYLILSSSSGIINFFFATINLGLPFFLVDRLHLTNTQYGMTESAFAGGMFIGGLLLSRVHFQSHPLKIAYISLSLFSLIVTLIGLPTLIVLSKVIYTVVFMLINFVLGLLLVFSNTPVDVYMQQNIPEKMQGRIFSLDETLSTVLMPVGTLVFGVLFDRFNTYAVFIFGGLVMFLLSFLVLLILQNHRTLG